MCFLVLKQFDRTREAGPLIPPIAVKPENSILTAGSNGSGMPSMNAQIN
jgi:hypothetical protein